MTKIEPADTDLPQYIVDAIRQAWPDGAVNKPDHLDGAHLSGMHQKLKANLSRIAEARILYETEPQHVMNPVEGSTEESSDPDQQWRSYSLFFVSPNDQVFEFETDTIEPDEDGIDRRHQGHGWMGCVAAISVVAPLAAVSFDDMEVFENGSRINPDVEPHIFSLDLGKIDWDTHLLEMVDAEGLLVLKNLLAAIVHVLKESEIAVIPEMDLDRQVPWLRTGNRSLQGEPGEPISVRQAFFFRGL